MLLIEKTNPDEPERLLDLNVLFKLSFKKTERPHHHPHLPPQQTPAIQVPMTAPPAAHQHPHF